MRFILSAILILALIAVVTLGKAQYPYGFHGYHPLMARHQAEGRFFFTTFTYTVATSTTTAIITSTTTCTTSSTTLTTCIAGRRRRDTRNPRGLFYDENKEEVEDADESIFQPSSNQASAESTRSRKQFESQSTIPVAIQPTFGAYYSYQVPDSAAVPLNRFLLAFTTATVTATSISTATSKLIATCSSTTGYQTCSS